MTSMQEIADKAGVSRATVSRVLSNHPSVKADTRKKVMYWVKKMNYEPNMIAQSLAGNSTNLIGVIVPEIAYPFFSEIIEAIERQAFYEGYSIVISKTNRKIEKEKNIIAEYKKRKVDGIIAVPVSERESVSVYKKISIPVTVITKKINNFNSIYISHYKGGEQIAKHFINSGFKKIGYIGPISNSTSARKFAGFKDYLKNQGVQLTDIIECNPPKNMNATLVAESVKEYISNKEIGSEVFFANDDISACEAINAFKMQGYDIPNDIKIAGFDNTLLAREMNPRLTSLAQPLEAIGKKAVQVLINQINYHTKPHMYEMESYVVERESTLNLNIK